MDKKKLGNILNLVIAAFAILSAIFSLVNCIKTLTSLGDNGVKANIWLVIAAILMLALTVGLALFGVKLLLPFLKGEEDSNSTTFILLTYFGYEVIINFLNMCFWTFKSTSCWLMVVFGLIGLVLIVVNMFGSVEDLIEKVLNICVLVAAFLCTIFGLVYGSGITIALYIFLMFMVLAMVLYVITFMALDNQKEKD